MQLIILLLLHTRRIPEKNKSKRRASTYFQCTNIQKKCSSLLHTTMLVLNDSMHTLPYRNPWWCQRRRRRSGCPPQWGLCGCLPDTTCGDRRVNEAASKKSCIPVIFFCLVHDLINAGLRLRHLTRPSHLGRFDLREGVKRARFRESFHLLSNSYLDVSATDENPIHLVKSKLRCLRLFKLNKCKALPRKVWV